MDTKAIAISSAKAKVILFAVSLGILTVIPSFIHSQWITGPMVNAVLLISAVLIGPMEAVFLGLMPSTVALSAGLLPLPLAPMVPFIMIGNAVMIAVFHYSYKKNIYASIGAAALLKFAFLHFSVVLIMAKLLDSKLTANLAMMMSWPQFVTAIIGGVVAYGFLKGVKLRWTSLDID
jgi:hypothetical protein